MVSAISNPLHENYESEILRDHNDTDRITSSSHPQHETSPFETHLSKSNPHESVVGGGEFCDACPYCEAVPPTNELLDDEEEEEEWHNTKSTPTKKEPTKPPFRLFGSSKVGKHSNVYVTPCQVRRHNHTGSAWLVCGDAVYDATPFIRNHPGGVNSILKKSGGACDCTVDMNFHSSRAIKLWKNNFVGTLCPCPGQDDSVKEQQEQCVIS